MIVIADRVFETSTTQGTGDILLAGPPTGFQSFVAGIGDTNQTYYHIDDGEDWESGIGTVTAGDPDILSRDEVLASSNAGAAVDWGAGTRNVRQVNISAVMATLRTSQEFTGDNTFSSKVAFKDKGELTISSGAVTVTGVSHTIDTESDAATDDLDTINGMADGQILVIRPANTDRTVVLKHNTGNIITGSGSDLSLDSDNKFAIIQYDDELEMAVVIATNNTATAEQGEKADTAVQPGDAFGAPLLHIQEQQTAGVPGNALTTSWTDRVPNTVVYNDTSVYGASPLTSGVITIPAGSYEFICVTANGAASSSYANTRDKLYNITASADIQQGLTSKNLGGFDVKAFQGRFTLGVESEIKIQSQIASGVANSYQGDSDFSSGIDVYTDIKLWKVG